jgi:PAS domain S-box-containing protein
MTKINKIAGQDDAPRPDATEGAVSNALSHEANSLHRQQAEARLRQHSSLLPEQMAALSPAEARHLLHELGVHQIELEMQNEELRSSQFALDAARERYFDLYDLAPVGYLATSEHGMIRQANLTAAGLFGMVRSALLNHPLSQRILNEDQDVYYRHRKLLIENQETPPFELRMVKQDGTSFWAHLTMTLASGADGAPEMRAVLSDISDRKQVESERLILQQDLQTKNDELERARVVADKANQAKSDFLSSMSHELRTPLHAILGFGQLLGSGTSADSPPPTLEQKKSIEQILKAGWHLLELINEILDLSVIEAGKIVLSMESLSLPEIIRECQNMIEPMAQQRAIRVILPEQEIPCFIEADRIRIKQILINLLSNAIKYNKPGGTVSITYGARRAGHISICVTDTGAGLSQDNLLQLFQPFSRLSKNIGKEEGTGIGLVVCKRLVELMGGTIDVESIVGKGSTFSIELAQATSRQTTNTPATLAVHGDNQTGDRSKEHSRSLLYVEDNLANLMLVQSIIARRPLIRLLTAPNGKRGIDMAREYLPDIILMDIDLPDISGIEVLKMLSDDVSTAHIPVIAISANAMPRDIEMGKKAGFVRYLTKPINVDAFMKFLDEGLIVETAPKGAAA